jgi:hypothetical protein
MIDVIIADDRGAVAKAFANQNGWAVYLDAATLIGVVEGIGAFIRKNTGMEEQRLS